VLVFVRFFEPGLMLMGMGVHATFLVRMLVIVLGVLVVVAVVFVGVHGTLVSMLVSVGIAVIMLGHLVSSVSATSKPRVPLLETPSAAGELVMIHHEAVGQFQVVRRQQIGVAQNLVRRTVRRDTPAVQDHRPPADLVGVG
jgi:hypothetical protein